MRAWVGSFNHETNAFSPLPTTRASYRYGNIGYEDLLGTARDAGCTVVAGPSLRAAPSAPTLQRDYEFLRDQMLDHITASGELDLILLALHGSQVAQGYPNCEADLVGAIRRCVGERVVIGVMLDLHAGVTGQLLQVAHLVTVIKEYPHTDYPETARQLTDLAVRTLRGEIAPVTAFVPLPLYTLWHTPELPSRAVVERARALEAEGQALHISLVHGFPWADVPAAGAAVLVITDAQVGRARTLAQAFALALWDIREADLGHYQSFSDALDEAMSVVHSKGPVVIADAGDNPGAGTGADATWTLQELIQRDIDNAALGMIYDPVSVAAIVAAGQGNTVELSLGGYSGALAGPPVVAEFEVLCIRDDACIDGLPGYPPVPVETLCAVRLHGIDIVVSDYREQVFGPRLYTEVGIEVSSKKIVVVKSAQHFYQAFNPLAARVIYSDTPCSRTVDFASLPFRNRRSPLWPLDPCSVEDIPPARVFRSE